MNSYDFEYLGMLIDKIQTEVMADSNHDNHYPPTHSAKNTQVTNTR